MYTDLGVICDAATSDSNGKLNILGVFDQINAIDFPAIHPQCAIVFRIVFDKGEEVENKFKLEFLDQNKKPLLPSIEAKSNTGVIKYKDRSVFNLIVGIASLKIPAAGDYHIELFFGGNFLKRIELRVRKILPTEN